MNRTRLRAAALLGAMFVVGVLAGVWGRALLHRHGVGRSARPTPEAMTDRLGRKLDLSPAQRDSVRAILERHRPTLDSLWQEFRPRLSALERTVNGEIEAQLDVKQRERFAELRQRFGRMHDAPRPPGEAH